MSISYQIPVQSRYVPTATVFTAVFNANPLNPGKYDFSYSGAGNTDVQVLDLQPDTIYLIERISAGGNLTEGQYLESIDTFCTVRIKQLQQKKMVYQFPVPINSYFDGQEAACWINTQKGGDKLILTFEGVLNQLPSMVGIASAKISIALNIFAIDSAYFNATWQDEQARSIGQVNRR